MKKIPCFLPILLIVFPVLVGAQEYQWEHKPFPAFPSVSGIKDIKTNDGIRPLERNPKLIARVIHQARKYPSGKRFVLCNGTRIVRLDSLILPYRYPAGDTGLVNYGEALYVIAGDEQSYVVLLLDDGSEQRFFNRQSKALSAVDTDMNNQYFNDAPILGMMPGMDVEDLYSSLYVLFPQKPCDEPEEKKE